MATHKRKPKKVVKLPVVLCTVCRCAVPFGGTFFMGSFYCLNEDGLKPTLNQKNAQELVALCSVRCTIAWAKKQDKTPVDPDQESNSGIE